MRILALDLGTSTGWAICDGEDIKIGTWRLASDKEVRDWGKVRLTRRNDPRVKRLCHHISGLGIFDVIIYEDVQFLTTQLASQMWAGLRSSVWLCGIAEHFDCLPVSALKKHATGNGAATKDAMAACLKRDRPDLYKLCDSEDAVDATHLLLWGIKNLTRIAPSTTIPQ